MYQALPVQQTRIMKAVVPFAAAEIPRYRLNKEQLEAARELVYELEFADLWAHPRSRIAQNELFRIDLEHCNVPCIGQPGVYNVYSLQRNGPRQGQEPTTYVSVYLAVEYGNVANIDQQRAILRSFRAAAVDALYKADVENQYERQIIPLAWQVQTPVPLVRQVQTL